MDDKDNYINTHKCPIGMMTTLYPKARARRCSNFSAYQINLETIVWVNRSRPVSGEMSLSIQRNLFFK